MKSNQFKESSIKALNDWINDGHSIREIAFPELLDELLIYSRNYIFSINYKPTKMKQFKNRFAVTGDIIQLLTFERELINLGYTLVAGSLGKSDVFNYRGISKNPATYITVGLHTVNSVRETPGSYIPTSNDGNAKMYNVLYDLSSQFEEALKIAGELTPLFTTADGKEIFDTKTRMYGAKQISSEDGYIYCPLYKNHICLDTNFSSQISPKWRWFSSDEARKKYIDSVTPVLITEDGVPKFLGNTVWYIRPNWVYHFWRTGIKESYTNSKEYIYFDKEENLIAYIKENRPVLNFSKAEMEKFITELTGNKIVVDIEYPKDFVKRD